MAFLGLRVPPETARILSEINFGDVGEKEPPSSFHTTMVYLGKEVPIEKIAALIPVVFSVVTQTKPFTVATKKVSAFPPNPDDGTPIIALIDSPELHVFRKAITNAFDAAKIDYNKKYPNYVPHVTLGYSSEIPEPPINLDIPVVEWAAHELVLWGGDTGDNRLIVTFPLSIAVNKTAMHRAFVQLAKNWSLSPEF